MAKRKGINYEQKLIDALKKLPNPLEDKKHNIYIFFLDTRARSNQSRFEHIIDSRHGLYKRDIERIPQYINKCIFKKDKERKGSYSIYIKRDRVSDDYIKISISIDPKTPKIAIVKTIFITRIIK